MKKKIISLIVVVLIFINSTFPIITFGKSNEYENKEEISINKPEEIKIEEIEEVEEVEEVEEETENYTEEYKKWLELSEEEKLDCDVIPRKYNVPTSVLYDDTNLKTAVSNDLKRNIVLKNSNKEALPEKYDLRDIINIPIKNQDKYGLCWNFASLTSLETYLALNGYGDYDFSEIHMDYLGSSEFGMKMNLGQTREIHKAGSFEVFERYLMENFGPVLESEVPYNSSYTIDEYDYLLNLEKNIYVGDTVKFPKIINNPNDSDYNAEEFELFMKKAKEHILTNGSLYCAIVTPYEDEPNYNAENFAEFYNGDQSEFKDKLSDHAVSIIGWDDTFSRENFNENMRPEHDGAFIALNSWGEEWGDNGIFYISYEDNYLVKELSGVVNASTNINEALEKIQFNDMNLYTEMKKILDRKVTQYDDNTKTIYVSKLAIDSILTLELNDKNISDLKGLEYFKNARNIDLSNNNIENIELLEELCNNNTTIDLSNNKIKNVSALKNARSINISQNQIETGFSELKNAGMIIANNCNLDDEKISGITEFSKLYTLELKNNNIQNVEVFKDLNISVLYLSGNTNLTGLETLTTVENLELNNCNLTNEDITSLKDLPKIQKLKLENNNITDVSELKDLKLWELDLSGNKGIELNKIPKKFKPEVSEELCMVPIVQIHLNDCNIEDISEISEWEIQNIFLKDNPISDLTPIKDNQSITYIDLSNTNVTDVSSLKNIGSVVLNKNHNLMNLDKLENVFTLYLEDCGISDISFISSLNNLYEIYLKDNNISQIPTDLGNTLNHIELQNNKIVEFPDLSNTNVSIIELEDNLIENIEDIETKLNLNCWTLSVNLSNNKIKIIPQVNSKINIIAKNITLTDVPRDYNRECKIEKEINCKLEINKNNRIQLPDRFQKENENRYKNRVIFNTENCTIDNKNGEIIIKPEQLGEGHASVTVESNSTDCKIAGSKITINFETKEKIEITKLELIDTEYKDAYIEGENFDSSELKVRTVDENGFFTTITDYEIQNGEDLQLDQTSVKIKYGEKELEVPISVYSKDNCEILFSTEIYDAVLEPIEPNLLYSKNIGDKVRCIIKKEAIDNITELDLSSIEKVRKYDGLSDLYNLKEIKSIDNCIYNQEILFDEICKLTKIEQLKFNGCSFIGDKEDVVNNECIEKVLKLPNLQLIDFGNKYTGSFGYITDKIYYLPDYFKKDDLNNITATCNYIKDNIQICNDIQVFVDENEKLYIVLDINKDDVELNVREDGFKSFDKYIEINLDTKIKNTISYFYNLNPETDKPLVEITVEPETEDNKTNSNTVTYTFSWNEKVYDFTKESIIVENGEKGEFTEITPNRVYTLVVTNDVEENEEGTQKIIVNENTCTDLSNNGNEKAEKGITIDKKIKNEENPSEENPGEENPGEENPGEENPGEENPGEENPGEENPGEEKPGEEKPEEENPSEEKTSKQAKQKETTTTTGGINSGKDSNKLTSSNNEDTTVSKEKIEQAGLSAGVGGLIIVAIASSGITFIKYRKYKEIK